MGERVLRLLLQGVAPERILCLTFTKAGAAEMAERVHERLARWVRAPGPEVAADLMALGEDYGPDALMRARLLFARVLEATGGGLKIQTIHSFCQSLLASFPLEAGLVPGFTPLDERGQRMLARGALITALEKAEAELDQPVLDAIAALSMRLGEDGVASYLSRCVGALAVLEALVSRLGKPVSRNALFEKVFSFDDDARVEAIEIYVHRLRKKLEGTGAYVSTLRGLGYVLSESGNEG